MACINNCRLCNNLVISDAVTFDGTNLVIDLPAGNYANRSKVCVVIAQAIPDETTIVAPVVFTIGGVTTTTYPFLNECCTPVLASQVRTRRVYSTIVSTTTEAGAFKYIGSQRLPASAGTEPASLPLPVVTP